MTKWFVLFWVLAASGLCLAQSESATLSGRVSDPSGAPIVGAEVVLTNTQTNVEQRTKTNEVGLYVFPGVHPGTYRVAAGAPGFRVLIKEGLTLHVQDELAENFSLTIGAISESMTVTADATPINTTDASVSTVVDRQFAEHLPMNGRSFQTLIELTPGVVPITSNFADGGQFSVNGQRGASNYWTVDGVSANVGIGANRDSFPGNGLSGSLGSFSALGGTNSLVSVDALQEFRIETSTYAPEFGRTPGGQISIVTRSGTNQFHGTAFDYLRNDVLDASNWFNGYTNNPPLPKAEERQNDFGGTLSGPILNNHTFFFFSYEGLRLRLPQTTLTAVPDVNARQTAVSTMQSFLNAFPLPNGPDNIAAGIAVFNSSYSNSGSLDAYSLRVDQKLGNRLTLFGRYNYSPSNLVQRGANANSLNTVTPTNITTQTATIGTTWAISAALSNETRFNYSRTNASSNSFMDSFGGAVPLTSLPFPSQFTAQNGLFFFDILSLQQGQLFSGHVQRNLQRQINIVDGLSLQRGSHSLKFGIDFRRLTPLAEPQAYLQDALFRTVPDALNGKLRNGVIASNISATFLFRNLGLYAQDTWRLVPRLTLTYGLRWDIDFVPGTLNGPRLAAVTGFNLNDLSTLALAPTGTPPYHTRYTDFAPRVGLAYQISQNPDWETILRGGVGIFYDLATSEVGNLIYGTYPFGAQSHIFGGTFPFSPAMAAPPAITTANLAASGSLSAFDPNLRSPYTLQWNVAFEQALGKQQTISASYIGASGRLLLQTANVFVPNPSFASVQLLANAGSSSYNALQIQFQRRLSRGFQVLSSYSWSHSIDTGSAGSIASPSNLLIPSSSANRGPSDFDIRNSFSAGVTYDVPAPKTNAFVSSIVRGWSLQNVVQVHSAPPVDVSDVAFFQFNNGTLGDIRPDLVSGQLLYLFGSNYPGGKAFNPAAFTDPPFDPNTFNPLRQGTTPRNILRGFGAAQWDLGVHRDFPIRESLKLQFRAEMFNVLNHPNFGPPSGAFVSPTFGGPLPGFGVSSQMLGQSLAGTDSLGSGGFSPLYQIGGPRSIQVALKLAF